MSFERSLAFVLQHEGGWVLDPADPGLETYRGISRRAHPDWDGWATIDRLPKPIVGLIVELEPLVRDLYFSDYWVRSGCCDMPERLAFVMFDWAVNSGASRVVKELQRFVGAYPDGIWGEKTKASVDRWMDRSIALPMIVRRRQFLAGQANPRFARGWRNRVDDLLVEIA